MTQTQTQQRLILTTTELDAYVRNRIDTVLIGKPTNSPRLLHLPAETGCTDVACKARTEREDGWLNKPVSVFPPGYHPFCTWCSEHRFGVEVIDE